MAKGVFFLLLTLTLAYMIVSVHSAHVGDEAGDAVESMKHAGKHLKDKASDAGEYLQDKANDAGEAVTKAYKDTTGGDKKSWGDWAKSLFRGSGSQSGSSGDMYAPSPAPMGF